MGTEQWPLFNQYCPVTSWEGRPASGLWPTFHMHGKHRDRVEFWEVHVKSKQNRSGMHCIAPGCTNHFYKKQEKVHYHRLLVAKKELLMHSGNGFKRWNVLTPQWTAIHVFVATTSCQRIMSWLGILMNWVNTRKRGQIGWRHFC